MTDINLNGSVCWMKASVVKDLTSWSFFAQFTFPYIVLSRAQ